MKMLSRLLQKYFNLIAHNQRLNYIRRDEGIDKKNMGNPENIKGEGILLCPKIYCYIFKRDSFIYFSKKFD